MRFVLACAVVIAGACCGGAARGQTPAAGLSEQLYTISEPMRVTLDYQLTFRSSGYGTTTSDGFVTYQGNGNVYYEVYFRPGTQSIAPPEEEWWSQGFWYPHSGNFWRLTGFGPPPLVLPVETPPPAEYPFDTELSGSATYLLEPGTYTAGRFSVRDKSDFIQYTLDLAVTFAPVPEPASLLLFMAAIPALWLARRLRRTPARA